MVGRRADSVVFVHTPGHLVPLTLPLPTPRTHALSLKLWFPLGENFSLPECQKVSCAGEWYHLPTVLTHPWWELIPQLSFPSQRSSKMISTPSLRILQRSKLVCIGHSANDQKLLNNTLLISFLFFSISHFPHPQVFSGINFQINSLYLKPYFGFLSKASTETR